MTVVEFIAKGRIKVFQNKASDLGFLQTKLIKKAHILAKYCMINNPKSLHRKFLRIVLFADYIKPGENVCMS